MPPVDPLASTLPPPYDSAIFRAAKSARYRVPVWGSFPKSCACGRQHSASEWARLPYCGEHDDGEIVLELRNCACGSTIAVEVER